MDIIYQHKISSPVHFTKEPAYQRKNGMAAWPSRFESTADSRQVVLLDVVDFAGHRGQDVIDRLLQVTKRFFDLGELAVVGLVLALNLGQLQRLVLRFDGVDLGQHFGLLGLHRVERLLQCFLDRFAAGEGCFEHLEAGLVLDVNAHVAFEAMLSFRDRHRGRPIPDFFGRFRDDIAACHEGFLFGFDLSAEFTRLLVEFADFDDFSGQVILNLFQVPIQRTVSARTRRELEP